MIFCLRIILQQLISGENGVSMYQVSQFLLKCYSRTLSVANMSAKRTPNPAKAAVRELIDKRLAAMTDEERKRESEIIYNKIINHPYYKSAKRISIFLNTPSEVNTAPIIEHIKARGAIAFVPQYAGGKMKMLRLEPGDEEKMPVTKHGIAQHPKELEREDALDKGLDLIIAPGAAFTREGGRCGHGSGYYDKYIYSVRQNPETAPKVVAVGFKCQILDKGQVPMDELDQVIDEVIFADE